MAALGKRHRTPRVEGRQCLSTFEQGTWLDLTLAVSQNADSRRRAAGGH
jgi:hypothetical protein